MKNNHNDHNEFFNIVYNFTENKSKNKNKGSRSLIKTYNSVKEEVKYYKDNDNETISDNSDEYSDHNDNYISCDAIIKEDKEEEKNNENIIDRGNDINDNNIDYSSIENNYNEDDFIIENENENGSENDGSENNNININEENNLNNNNNNENDNINTNNEVNNIDQQPIYSEKSSIYFYNCANDYYNAEQYKKSLPYIIIYIKLIPNNPKALSLKGKIYSKLNMFQEALNNFKKSIKLGDDNNLENIYGCAKAYKELNLFENSLYYYKKALSLDKSAKSYYLLGTCLYSMGKKEEAIESYDKSISLDQDYFLAYYSKGICLSNLNLKEEAITMYDKVISINNNFIDAYFQKGYCLYSIKQYELALEQMNKVLELDPNYYEAYYEKGFCLLKLKKINEAIAEISKYIQQNDTFENAYFQRGYCYELIKNYSLAINDYYKVIEINNYSNEVYFRLGICLLNQKNVSDSLKMFNRAIKINRANYEAYYFKGICQRYLKLYENAIMTFNFFLNCVKLNKNLYKEIGRLQIINVYYNKGMCLIALNRYTEAIGMFTHYLKTDKNCLDIYYERAICYYETHKYNEAINDLSFIINNFDNYEKDKTIISQHSILDRRQSDIFKNIDDDIDNGKNDSFFYCENEKIIKDCEINDNIHNIYLLRGKSFLNINEIENSLNDFNEFFSIIKRKFNKNYEKYINIKDLTKAYFNRGYCNFIKKKYILALKDYEKTLEFDQSNTTAYFNMAICLYNLNRKKESIQFYEKILNECPSDIEAQLGICKACREIGDLKRAFDFIEKAFLIFKNDSPKIANLYYEKGMCLYNMDKYEEAINSFEKAIEFSHVNKKLLLSDCYYHKGICLLKLNRKESAIKDFDQAIKYNSNNEDIFNDKAYCLIALEKYEDVINSYLKAIELNKEVYAIKSDGYFNIAYCYIQLKNYKEAKKYLALSQKVNEDKIKKYFNRGLISCESGGFAPQNYLIDFSKKYKDLCTKFNDINYYLGICNKELNRCVEALDNFNMCIKYDDKFGEAYYYKGLIFSDLKKDKRAIKQFKKAVECNNKNEVYKKALKKEENKLKSKLDKIKVASINLDDDNKSNENKVKRKIPTQRNSNTLIKINNSLNVEYRMTERNIQNNKLKLYIKGNNVYKKQNISNKSDPKINKNITNFSSLNRLNKANFLNTSIIKNNKKEIIDAYNKTEKINKRFKNKVSASFKYSGNNIIKSTDFDLRNISPYKKYKNSNI